jgi:hypothetical protein
MAMAGTTCSLCGNQRGPKIRVGGLAQIIICYGCVQDLGSAEIVPAGSSSVCALCGRGEARRSWFRRRIALLFRHPSGTVVCGPCVSLARDVLAEEAGAQRR